MARRAIIWTLAIAAAVLVALPLVSMLGMTACCGIMGPGGLMSQNMMGMTAVGVIWWLVAAAFVIALIVVLVRSVSRV
jgi:hypothetical protein